MLTPEIMNPAFPPSKKRRVLVVENHRFFRENLVNWIGRQEQLECCGEAETLAEAKRALDAEQPDLILLDLSLNDGSSGFDLLRWLKHGAVKTAVIVLSQHEEERYATPALEAGARGYVSKGVATEELSPAINAVFDGQCYVSGRGAFPPGA
jgi:DNA-binding NarL/FixJ family response regulator